MEIFSFSFRVDRKIRGRNEFEIYKNFVTEHSSSFTTWKINHYFESRHLKTKDDLKSQQLRKEGNEDYKNGNYKESANTYTKSLCYATYNSEAYATTLANRSAVFFKRKDYESCIKDIDLCLKADYPEALRPKVCIRKAECYKNLGDPLKMRSILLDVLNVIDSMELSLKPIAENYRTTVKELITEEADTKKDEANCFDKLPTFDANPSFLGASTAIELQYPMLFDITSIRSSLSSDSYEEVYQSSQPNGEDTSAIQQPVGYVPMPKQHDPDHSSPITRRTRRRGARVVAKKEIAPGDILFVEKAYAFICHNDNETFSIHCQNCLKKAASCVPCKGCVEHLYCSEECRDAAWNDFHQWECTALQAKVFSPNPLGSLSLRILFKGLQTGLSMKNVDFENEVINNYGNIDDNYPYIYSLPTNIDKVEKETLELIAETAEILTIYLKLKTNFFDHLKKWPTYANKSNKDLTNKIGGLLIRHIIQLHWSAIKVRIIEDGIPIKSVTVGAAICPSLAMTTHSCKPNTTLYFLGDTVVVKAIENIKPNEEVYHAYHGIDHDVEPNLEERQMKLLKQCFLNCKCRVCTNPKMTDRAYDAYICVKCKGPLIRRDWRIGSFAVGTCLDCNSESNIPSEVALREGAVWQKLVKFEKFNDLKEANQGLQLAKTIYQPYHRVIRDFYQELAEYYLKTGNLKCYVKMQKFIEEYFDKYYGNLSLPSGAIRFTYCFSCLQWLKDNLVNRYFQVGEILEELKKAIEELKVIMDLHFPPFLEKVAKLEKLILELQVMGVTQDVYNMHLDCFE